MKLRENRKHWEPAPEGNHRAVCVDFYVREKVQTVYGEKDLGTYVYEIEAVRDDGTPFTVRTRGMTLSVNEKSNMRKHIRGCLGRDLTPQELDGFDPESMVGRPAQVLIVHEHKDGETYANLMACTPDKSDEPLKPSGSYVRVKDRPPRTEDAGQGTGGGGQGSYRRAAQPAAAGPQDDGTTGPQGGSEALKVKIHVGRCKGLELRDLAPEQVGALIEHWLPGAKANPKPLADDRRLMAALEWWAAQQEKASDDIPY